MLVPAPAITSVAASLLLDIDKGHNFNIVSNCADQIGYTSHQLTVDTGHLWENAIRRTNGRGLDAGNTNSITSTTIDDFMSCPNTSVGDANQVDELMPDNLGVFSSNDVVVRDMFYQGNNAEELHRAILQSVPLTMHSVSLVTLGVTLHSLFSDWQELLESSTELQPMPWPPPLNDDNIRSGAALGLMLLSSFCFSLAEVQITSWVPPVHRIEWKWWPPPWTCGCQETELYHGVSESTLDVMDIRNAYNLYAVIGLLESSNGLLSPMPQRTISEAMIIHRSLQSVEAMASPAYVQILWQGLCGQGYQMSCREEL